jgi:hypothetical protein
VAGTAEATALTEQHRQVQLAIRLQAVNGFSKIWPLWTPDKTASFADLVTASATLVVSYHSISAAAAASYFTAFRTSENVAGAAAPVLAAPPAEEMVAASLYATGEQATRKALDAGQSPDVAMQTAFVRTSGAVTRHILNGSRETIISSVQDDQQALGWARVTDGDPCAFCLVLASRGPVYKTEATADFQAHDHCGCMAEPFYSGSDWPAGARDALKTYDAAQQWGIDNGLLQPGENSSSARINAVRRYLVR